MMLDNRLAALGQMAATRRRITASNGVVLNVLSTNGTPIHTTIDNSGCRVDADYCELCAMSRPVSSDDGQAPCRHKAALAEAVMPGDDWDDYSEYLAEKRAAQNGRL